MDNERRLEGGKLLLFTRNGIWQARVAIGDRRYLWKSLKTSNEMDAERAAVKLFHITIHKLDEGLPVQSRSFSSVLNEYEAFRENDHDVGKAAKRGSSVKHTSLYMLRQIRRVSKFWHEYAGKRSIETIDDKALAGFIPWRKAYYHGKKDIHHNAKLDPTDKTLQWEIMLAKMVLKYAREQGYLGKRPLPSFTFTPKLKRVRPHFTSNEFRTLRAELRKWVENTTNPAWKKSRQLLHDYVHALGMAGLRTGEANNLRIRDVDRIVDVDGRSTIQLYVKGKTGTRTVQPHIELGPIVEAMISSRGEVKANDWLFIMPDGSQIITLIDQFNTFLKHAGLTHTGEGAKYTLYSLRHYYAVRSLGRADIYAVAQNMGTSVQMIEQYYGKHGISPERARRLAGEVGEANAAQRLTEVKPRLEKKTLMEVAKLAAAYMRWFVARFGRQPSTPERFRAIKLLLEALSAPRTTSVIRRVSTLANTIDAEDIDRLIEDSKLFDQFDALEAANTNSSANVSASS